MRLAGHPDFFTDDIAGSAFVTLWKIFHRVYSFSCQLSFLRPLRLNLRKPDSLPAFLLVRSFARGKKTQELLKCVDEYTTYPCARGKGYYFQILINVRI